MGLKGKSNKVLRKTPLVRPPRDRQTLECMMIRLAVILNNLLGGHLYDYLIRSPRFNRLAARTHAKVQQMKVRFTSTGEELQQLKENQKLLKEAEEKFKSIEGESNGTELDRFWKIFKEEFRNIRK